MANGISFPSPSVPIVPGIGQALSTPTQIGAIGAALGATQRVKNRATQEQINGILSQTIGGRIANLDVDLASKKALAEFSGIPVNQEGRLKDFVGTIQQMDIAIKSGPEGIKDALSIINTSIDLKEGFELQTPRLTDLRNKLMEDPLSAVQAIAGFVEGNIQAGILRGRPGTTESAEGRAFSNLIKDMTPEQQKKAKLIKARLEPGAVGSSAQTISDLGTSEEVGASEAIIAQRKKFAEATGSSRAKFIDSGFNRIVKIDKGIFNIGRAIKVIQSGAGTGAIERFLPSFKAASVELDQIQKELALDVISGVTLGAISATELDLVKQVALPFGLDGEPLIKHLQERKAAQEKLRAYFQEQIDFLDSGGPDGKGGTIAGFLRQKKGEKLTDLAEGTDTPEAATGAPVFLGFE